MNYQKIGIMNNDSSNSSFEASRIHWGDYEVNAEKLGFNTIVITGNNTIGHKLGLKFGRLVQIRKKASPEKTDLVIIREADGGLQSFYHMSFYSVKKEYLHLYEDEMKNVPLDEPNKEYFIEGNDGARGFVVSLRSQKISKLLK